ncbi:MAG: Phosphoglycolate phosphatase [Pseudomonadota bacterium]|jgi:beta-phosphoglucomutase-like phosphatase (HAD superfamily)
MSSSTPGPSDSLTTSDTNHGHTIKVDPTAGEELSTLNPTPSHHRHTFLEGDKSYKGHVHGHSRLDLHAPLLTYLSAPLDQFIIPNSIKALVIDFDGTTIKIKYSEGARQAAYRAAIKHLVKDEHGLDLSRDQIDSCHRAGVNNPEAKMAELIAQEIQKNHGLLLDHAKLYAYWLKQCDAQLASHDERHRKPVRSALVPGMELLIDAANARGIPVSVCTAGDNQFVEPLLNKTGIMPRLHGQANVFINRHPDIQSKPAGDPYILAAKFLGVEPHQMLVLEDTATGALAALRAGARVLLQPSGDREQTIRKLLYHVKKEHPEWLEGRPGAVTILSKDRGFLQVLFPPMVTPQP